MVLERSRRTLRLLHLQRAGFCGQRLQFTRSSMVELVEGLGGPLKTNWDHCPIVEHTGLTLRAERENWWLRRYLQKTHEAATRVLRTAVLITNLWQIPRGLAAGHQKASVMCSQCLAIGEGSSRRRSRWPRINEELSERLDDASPSHCCRVPCAMTRQHFNPRSKIELLREDLEMVVVAQ